MLSHVMEWTELDQGDIRQRTRENLLAQLQMIMTGQAYDIFLPYVGLGMVTVNNTIIANSVGLGDCRGVGFTSLGHNLDSDGSCGLSGPGDISGVDPLLGPLAVNGGPTKTHALLTGSPAIDAVPIADCTDPDGNPITTDQRGVPRPQDAACDIGAFEFGLAATEVDIDINPGSCANVINFASIRPIPVAILTTKTFDALTVSPSTVKFGPAGASMASRSGRLKDVDKDGDLDLLLHFRTQETGIQCGDTEALLVGETFGGQAIQGMDRIVTVGCNLSPRQRGLGNFLTL